MTPFQSFLLTGLPLAILATAFLCVGLGIIIDACDTSRPPSLVNSRWGQLTIGFDSLVLSGAFVYVTKMYVDAYLGG